MSVGMSVGAMPRSVGSFTPTQISDLTGWWDASQVSTITTDPGGVTSWEDQSTNGRNVTQTEGGRKPVTGMDTINGLNVLDFNGTTQHLTNPSTFVRLSDGTDGVFTMFAVFQPDSVTGSHMILSQDRSNTGDRLPQAIRTNGATFGTIRIDTSNSTLTPVEDSSGVTITAGTTYVGTVQHRLTELETWLNGSSDGPTSTTGGNLDTTSTLHIGSRDSSGSPADFFDGRIAEIICYGAVLDATQRAQVETYLSTKWGITT